MPANAPVEQVSEAPRRFPERRDRQRGQHARGEVEDQEADRTEGLLDVVAEDPQEQHVAGEVHEAAMQEHRGHEGRWLGGGGHKASLIASGVKGTSRLRCCGQAPSHSSAVRV